jgi:hypothetical protein
MKYGENWFTKSAIALVLLLLVAGCLAGAVAMDRSADDSASLAAEQTDFVNATHELAERLADQPPGSPYLLIPRSANIAHETRAAESGTGTKRVTRASVDFNPRSFVLYTVLVWQNVKTKVNGEPVDIQIYYDVVPRGTSSSTRWRSQ